MAVDLATQSAVPMDADEEDEEELEDLPDAEKLVDPLIHAKITRTVDGKTYSGEVEDIEQGKVSKERLYRIKYDDGDLEHLTEDQVKEMQVNNANAVQDAKKKPATAKAKAEPKAKAKAKGKAKAAAKTIAKKPAAAPKAKAAMKKPAKK